MTVSSQELAERLGPDAALRFLEELEAAGLLSAVALDVPDDLSEARYDALCAYIGNISHATRWWIGDLICWGEGRYKDRVAQASELFGLSPGTLQNYASVCGRVSPARRKIGVPFHLHALVARLEPAEQERWLSAAQENGWNHGQLRVELERDGALPAKVPQPAWTPPEELHAPVPAPTPTSTPDIDVDCNAFPQEASPATPPPAIETLHPHAVRLALLRDEVEHSIERAKRRTAQTSALEADRDALNWALAQLAPGLA